MSFNLEADGKNDILDTRDIEDKLEELQLEIVTLDTERDDINDAVSELQNQIDELDEDSDLHGFHVNDLVAEILSYDNRRHELRDEIDEVQTDFDILDRLRDEVGPEFAHGVTLIHESYFEEYARQLADDIGAIDNSHSWPLTCIDWGQAADELLMDYTVVDLNGESYYFNA